MIVYIPARAGSKRIKNKNIKTLDNKPLITYVIHVAKKLDFISDIFVSTDSKDIQKICNKLKVSTLGLRKKNLSDDKSTFMDLIKYDIPRFADYSNDKEILFILPTAILITPKLINEAYSIYIEKSPNLLMSCEEPSHSIWWTLQMNNLGYLKPIFRNKVSKNSQFLKKTFIDSGLFYIFNLNKVRKYKSHKLVPKILPFMVDYQFRCDLNTPEDFELLKYKYKNFRSNA